MRWLNDNELIATQSQGLLLRPGKIVQAKADNLGQLVSVADAETSLWSVVNQGSAIFATDYKGRVLRAEGGKHQTFDLKSRWVRTVTTIPTSNSELLAGTEDGQLLQFNAETGAEVRKLALEPAAIFKIAFNQPNNQIAVACGDGNIHLLSWPALERVKSLKGNGAVWSLAYVDDGKKMVSGGADKKLRLWELESAQSIVAIASGTDWITSMQTLPGTSLVIAGCMNGQVVLADWKTKLPVKSVKGANSGIWDIAVSPDGKRVAMGTRKDGIQILPIESWYEEARQAATSAEADKPPQPSQ
ncbi:MAG: hypothetical protein U0930_22520 [Pirellulales bacterium]